MWFAVNSWYDGVEHPYRYAILLCLVIPALIVIGVGSIGFSVAGLVYLMGLLLFRLVYLERF